MSGGWKRVLELNRQPPGALQRADRTARSTSACSTRSAARREGAAYFERPGRGDGVQGGARHRHARRGAVPAAVRRRALLPDLPPLQRAVRRPGRRVRQLDLPLVRLRRLEPRVPVRPGAARSRAWPKGCWSACATRWTACSSTTRRCSSMVDDFGADGIVFHPIKSCRTVSTGLADSRRALMKARRHPEPVHRVRHDGPAGRLGGPAQEPDRRLLRGPRLAAAAQPPRRRPDRRTRMAYAAGVDVGSTQTKAVVIDEERRIVGRALIDDRRQRGDAPPRRRSRRRSTTAVVARGGSRVRRRHRLRPLQGDLRQRRRSPRSAATPAARSHMFPGTRTVLDMGGQDTKAIRVAANGEIVDFCMNDKCAAGTGRFLQARVASRSTSRSTSWARTALRGERPVKISTTCTVFAESEVLSWLGKGKKIEDILLGVHRRSPRARWPPARGSASRSRSRSPAAWRATSAMVAVARTSCSASRERQRGVALHGRARRGALRARPHPRQPAPAARRPEAAS